jgi:putative PEP-CTERM system TPR-repeat lipoprotein
MKISSRRLRRCAGAIAALVMPSALLLGYGAPAAASNADNAHASALSQDVRALVARADDAVRHGDLRVATLLLKNALQAAPREAAIRAELGNILVMQGATPEAEQTLREARSQGAPDSAVLPALFQAMLARHEAQALLDQFPEPAADNRSQIAADTLRARALAYFSLKNPDAADAEIGKALAIKRSAPILVNKAEFALAEGNRSMAQDFADEALKIAPQDSAALIMKIGLLERNGAYQEALGYANRLVKAYPDQALLRVLRIEIFAKLHQDGPAEADVAKLLAASPNMPVALYDRALLDARKGNIKDAWQIAQALPPEFVHTDPRFGLGVAEIAQASGNAEVSEAMLNSVIANYPGNEEARIRLAEKRLAQKDSKGALEALRPIEKSANPLVMAELGRTYQAMGQSDTARDYFAKASAAMPGGGPGSAPSAGSQPAGNFAQSIDRLSAMNAKDPTNADVAGTLVVALIRGGRVKDALAVADRFAKAAPKDPMAPYFRGQVAMATGDLDGAEQAFAATLKGKPGFAPALYYRAQSEAGRGDMTAANADLDTLLRADPKNAQALSKKAQFAMQAGQDDQAASLLASAVAASPQDAGPWLALADFYLSRKNYAKAEAAITSTLRQFPNEPRATATLILIQSSKGSLGQAKATATGFAKTLPNSAEAKILLGNVLAQANDQPGAVAAYQGAIHVSPNNLAAYQALINLYLRTGDKAKAVDVASSFATAQPGEDSDLLLADTLSLAGRTPDALAVLRKHVAQNPDSRSVLAFAGIESKTDRDSAEKRLSDWTRSHHDDAAAQNALAALLMADGKNAAAQAQLEQVVQLQPYNASALNDLAWTVQKSDPARAIRLAALAAKIAPRSGEILDTLAWLNWQQKDRKDSVSMLRQAHVLSPAEPNIAYHLAVALDGSGNRAEARQVLQALLKSNPSFSNGDEARRLQSQWR